MRDIDDRKVAKKEAIMGVRKLFYEKGTHQGQFTLREIDQLLRQLLIEIDKETS